MDGEMCQLCQETVRLFMKIQEKLQKEHTVSTTHFPITEEDTEFCTVMVKKIETIVDKGYVNKMDELNVLQTQLLKFIREINN